MAEIGANTGSDISVGISADTCSQLTHIWLEKSLSHSEVS